MVWPTFRVVGDPSLTGIQKGVARDRPGISHWPAESSANNVAAIGDVSAPTPSWYTPKPMERGPTVSPEHYQRDCERREGSSRRMLGSGKSSRLEMLFA